MGSGASSDNITVLSEDGSETLADGSSSASSGRDSTNLVLGGSGEDEVGTLGSPGKRSISGKEKSMSNATPDRGFTRQPSKLWTESGDPFSANERVQPEATVKDPLTIAEFDLMEVVGQGGFGKVWKARRKKTGKIYAVKIQSVDVKKDRQEALQRERKIMEEIKFPFVVKLHWSLENYSSLYLVLDYVPCGTLFNLQSKRPTQKFDEVQMQFYTMEVFLGLEHLHQNNVVFRDLKPENILVQIDGHLALTDFGLSKQFNKADTRHKSVLGTPEYMAPEMIWGNGYGIEVDFWALGCLLYEGLYGCSPFVSESTKAMFTKILSGKVQPMPAGTSGSCKQLIKGLLASEAADRVDAKGIREHPFFTDYSWQAIFDKTVAAPIIPEKSHPSGDPHEDGRSSNLSSYGGGRIGSTHLEGTDNSFRDYARAPEREGSKSPSGMEPDLTPKHSVGSDGSLHEDLVKSPPTSPNASSRSVESRISPCGTFLSTPTPISTPLPVKGHEYLESHPATRGNEHVPCAAQLLQLLDRFISLRSSSCLDRNTWEGVLDECFSYLLPCTVYRHGAGSAADGGHLKVLLGIDSLIGDLLGGRNDIRSSVPGFTGELRYVIDHRHVILGHNEKGALAPYHVAWSGFVESVHCQAKTPNILRMHVSKDFKIVKLEQTQDVLGFGRQMQAALDAAEKKSIRSLKRNTKKKGVGFADEPNERQPEDRGSSEGRSSADTPTDSLDGNQGAPGHHTNFGLIKKDDNDKGFFAPAETPMRSNTERITMAGGDDGRLSMMLDDEDEGVTATAPIRSVIDFEFIKVIGKGDFSTVWSAKRVIFTNGLLDRAASDVVVAVKVQQKAEIQGFGGVDRVVAERDLHLQLDAGGSSPFIATMLGAFQSRNYFFIELEYIECGTLFAVQEAMPKHRFSIEESRCLSAEVACAIGHIHDRNIIYRDLKPENVMVDSEGHIKLIDFGLAVNGPSFVVESGKHVGNVEYVSPEALMDKLAGYAVDWWAFGCLLYEMISGISPFFNDKIPTMHDLIVVGSYHELENFLPSAAIDPALPDLLNNLFNNSPTSRFGYKQTTRHDFFEGINWEAVKNRRLPSMTVGGSGRRTKATSSSVGKSVGSGLSRVPESSEEWFCAPCNFTNQPSNRFCGSCGTKAPVMSGPPNDPPDSPKSRSAEERNFSESSEGVRKVRKSRGAGAGFRPVQEGDRERNEALEAEKLRQVSSSDPSHDPFHEWQYETVKKFFKFRSETVTDASRWAEIVCELFCFAMPQMPYRNQAASTVCPATNMHLVIGIDELILDMDYARQSQAWQVNFELIPSEFYSKRCRSLAALNITFGPPDALMTVRGACKIQFSADKRLSRIEQCYDLNTFMEKWKSLCATTAPEGYLLSPRTRQVSFDDEEPVSAESSSNSRKEREEEKEGDAVQPLITQG